MLASDIAYMPGANSFRQPLIAFRFFFILVILFATDPIFSFIVVFSSSELNSFKFGVKVSQVERFLLLVLTVCKKPLPVKLPEVNFFSC